MPTYEVVNEAVAEAQEREQDLEHEQVQDENSPLLDTTITSAKVPHTGLLGKYKVVLVMLLFLLLEVGVSLMAAPLAEIVEDIICHEHFADLATAIDPRCKGAAVQGYLAMLQGWATTFDMIPGLIMAIPMGLVSDKYGRKPVLSLALLGLLCSFLFYFCVCWFSNVFPVWAICLASVFGFVGGGTTVVVSTLYTIVADVVSDDQRSTTFFRTGAILYVGEMFGSSLGGTLMKVQLWLPVFMGIGCFSTTLIVALLMPETLGVKSGKPIHSEQTSHDISAVDTSKTQGVKSWFLSHLSSIRAAFDFIWESDSSVVLLILVFIVTTLGRFAAILMMQYVTKRYHMSWAQASYFITMRAATNLVALVVVLPAASALLLRYYTNNQKDLWLARMTGLLLVIGSFTIAFAVNPFIMAIGLILMNTGTGFTFLIRSLVTTLVAPHHVGTLYQTISVCESLGIFVAGPSLSAAFRWGLGVGGVWVGIPFMISGAMFAVGAAVVWCLKVDRGSVV